MKKQIFSIFLTLILIFILKNTCNAANANISCADSVTVGDTINISVTGSAVQWNLELKVNGQVIAKNSEVDNIDGNKNINFSGKYTPTNVGTLNVTLTGTITEMSDGSTTRNFSPKTITVKAKDAPSSDSNNSGNGTTGGNTTASKSTEARLSKFGIRPKEYDFSGFSKNTDKENWDAGEVPNSVTEIEVYAEAKSDKAKVTGIGKVALKEGNNTIKVTVTAEAGNTKTYSLTIKRKAADEAEAQTQVSSDATLKKLGIKPDKYDFSGFKKDKTQYSVQVPKDVEEIEIYAEATSSKAKVVGTGKAQLKTGKNNLVVQVAAENGTTQTYTIEVTRGDAEATATTSDSKKNEFGLSSLDISGLTLSPSFKTGTYEYKVDLTEDLSSLDINAIATDDDTTVEILGNEELALGENTITILVRNEKEDKTATYQIIVNKNLSEEEKMSWLKPSTWGREKIIKIIIIAVLIILVVIAVILKIKIAREKEDEEDLEFPGGEELDKALAEHQVLSETAEMQMNLEAKNIKNEENNVYANEFDETNYIEDIARNKNYTENYQIDSFDNSSSKRKGKHF